MDAHDDITTILGQLSQGEARAFEDLLPLVYEELRELARGYMRRERPDHTLQATALLHEAYLRLQGRSQAEWQDRSHFLAAAAQTMRRILVDHARSRRRKKRGGDLQETELGDVPAPEGVPQLDILALDRALDGLVVEHARKCQVVELMFFGGLSAAEAGEVLGVTSRTVERDWQFARAWLLREMASER